MKADRINDIYEEISRYSIDLHPDPVSQGPRYLQRVTAECRNYTNSISRVLLEIHREKSHYESLLRAAEATLKIKSDDLLANEPRVRSLPNISDRQATINVLLMDSVKEVDDLKREVMALDHVEKAVKHQHRELVATSGAIRMQRQLLRDELDSGSFYGDERGPEGGTGKGRANDGGGILGSGVDEEELERIMRGEDESLPTNVPQAEAEAPVVVVESPSAQGVSLMSTDSLEDELDRFIATGSGVRAEASP